MTDIFIEGGRALLGQEICEASLRDRRRQNQRRGRSHRRAALGIDAGGLLVLPGIIDLHGDAFERQMMPRPGVDFPVDVALIDSDRQAISNGITTVFHGTTWSWEPGLRSGDNARKLLETIEALRPQLAADTRFHLRHETYNLDAEAEIIQWLSEGRIDLFAFNDHSTVKPEEARSARWPNAPGSRSRLSTNCSIGSRPQPRCAGLDRTSGRGRTLGRHPHAVARRQQPGDAAGFRAQGVNIAEFPVNEETARDAAAAGDFIVFGAPNVVRGGSHTGWTKASDMIAKGLCSVLASDYYYPAQLLAAFRLVADGVLPLPAAWNLISAAPARAAGLADRGVLGAGHRADLILVDDEMPLRPRIVAVIAAGRLVHLTDASRSCTVGRRRARLLRRRDPALFWQP